MSRTKSARNVAVGTTKKSIEVRTPIWFSKNARHDCDRGRPRRGRSRPTVRGDISIPSFVSSPSMRGAPHNGLALAMWHTSARISLDAEGRPPSPRAPDRQVPEPTKSFAVPGRNGLTITSACVQSDHVEDSRVQNRRSMRPNRRRPVFRCSRASCWSTTFSASTYAIQFLPATRDPAARTAPLYAREPQ